MNLRNSVLSIGAYYIFELVKELSRVVGNHTLETLANNDEDEEESEEDRPVWKQHKKR